MIELRGVTTVYEGERIPAIHEIDLLVERGEFLALIGPNGVGKTTLLETINGLLDHQAGAVRVFGLEVRREGHQLRQWISLSPRRSLSLS